MSLPFDPTCFWFSRQNPKLALALDQLVHMDEDRPSGVSSSQPDLMVSQDRFAVYRATQLDNADGVSEADGASYSTGES
jgi:hypothetical protein